MTIVTLAKHVMRKAVDWEFIVDNPFRGKRAIAVFHVILQPINADGTSVWHQGRTIPAKFRICNASGVSIGAPGVVTGFNLTGVINGAVSSVDETVSSTTPDSVFRWDPTGQQWIFNISTATLPAGQTYVYTIVLNVRLNNHVPIRFEVACGRLFAEETPRVEPQHETSLSYRIIRTCRHAVSARSRLSVSTSPIWRPNSTKIVNQCPPFLHSVNLCHCDKSPPTRLTSDGVDTQQQ